MGTFILGKESKNALNDLLKEELSLDDILNFGINKSNNELIDFLINVQFQVENVKDAIKDLGTSMRETVLNGTFKGLDNTMVTMGKHVLEMKENVYDADDAAKDYGKVWRNVGQEMLSSIGPAATQAGLSLITKGNIKAGLALIAAGGIFNFMSGLLNDNDDDKDKQQEARLKTLKDLLSDLIEQAKKDAEYYERNSRHENALSQANQISVNDAIISPSGNVISTAPDDYLIATKTPGSLVGGKSPVVNFTFVDKSTGSKEVNVDQKENADGSIDIVATIIDAVSSAVADGTMDDAFAARDYRLNGQSYAY